MLRPDFPASFDHLTTDGLRDLILATSDYLATFRREGPETKRAADSLARARDVLAVRIKGEANARAAAEAAFNLARFQARIGKGDEARESLRLALRSIATARRIASGRV